MTTGVMHIPGYGMVYDPNQIKIEGDKVFRKENGQWVEMQRMQQNQPSSYAQGAAAAGTLGARPDPQWPVMQQMAMNNPLPSMLGMLNALGQRQQIRQPSPLYENPYVNNLLRFM